jgi:hypothetical protein
MLQLQSLLIGTVPVMSFLHIPAQQSKFQCAKSESGGEES